jgi:pimeloyl-ACP methyl ester carboxylesterase
MLRSLVTPLLLLACFVIVIGLLVRLGERHLAFFPMRGEDDTPAAEGLRFTALDVRTDDGETLRAWWMPSEQPAAQIVYFHGNGGNLSIWTPILTGIRRKGYSILAIDYRGYGLSSGTPSERGIYRDADATLRRFESGLRVSDVPVVFWGRSLGTPVAAYAAARRPPDGVILEAGFPDVDTLFRWNPLMRMLSWFSSYRFPTARWMRQVSAPALVMHGTADGVIPFEAGRALFEQLPGPKQFVAIEGGDHNDLQPADPGAYWAAVEAFVRSLRK